MLRSAKLLVGYKVKGPDCDIGKVEEFYFDYVNWAFRYLIVDASDWIPAKHILISPASFSGKPDWHDKIFHVNLTKEKVKMAPSIDLLKPVTVKNEYELIKYHNWPIYWEKHSQDYMPKIVLPTEIEFSVSYNESENSHLRSTNEFTGYHILANNGEIGYVEDFIVDDVEWPIRYIAVNTHNRLPVNKIFIKPQWFKSVNWHKSKVHMDISKAEIQDNLQCDPL